MANELANHNYQAIDATVIADSKNEQTGDRITSFVLTLPRIVLAEFNTHRALSRNSASSRAIPIKTMLEIVRATPFVPIRWQKEHKGMQGTEYHSETDSEMLAEKWLLARTAAALHAEQLSAYPNGGVTKQLCNRLLEPFLWHTVIATGTELENFFALRAHPAAEIHIAKLAEMALDALNASTPKMLMAGQWHIPFGNNLDTGRLKTIMFKLYDAPDVSVLVKDAMVKIATARCARVSYLNFEGKDDYYADLKLYDMLAEMGHWSPFEHCATAMTKGGQSGNFNGFVQHRKTFIKENKTDSRVIAK